MITAFLGQSDWMEQGACLDADPDLFYNQSNERALPPSLVDLEAIEICKTCPVVAECLAAAIENGERWGIWGGKTPTERKAFEGSVKRGPYAIKHGTDRGYHAHRDRDVPICTPCRRAHNQANRERKMRRETRAKDTAA